MNNQSVFVEFIGMPGAGKSTLSHKAAGILRKKGSKICEPTYHVNMELHVWGRLMVKIFYSIKFAAQKPFWAASWLRLIFKSGQKTVKELIEMAVNCFFVGETMRRNRSIKGVYLLDQGIFQAVWSLSYNSRFDVMADRELVKNIKLVLPGSYRLFYISADRESIVRRLLARRQSQSRLELEKDRAKIYDLVSMAQNKLDLIVDLVGKEFVNIDFIEFRNNDLDDPGQIGNEIAEILARKIG